MKSTFARSHSRTLALSRFPPARTLLSLRPYKDCTNLLQGDEG